MKATQITKLFVMLIAFAFVFTACQEEEPMLESKADVSNDILKTLQNFDEELSYAVYYDAGVEDNARWGRGKGKKKGFAKRVSKVPTFFILTKALRETGLLKTVIQNKLTVFAPTDDAFKALLADLGISAEELLASDQLDEILLYHVVPGLLFSDDLEEGMVTTANGADVNVSFDDDHIFINESKVIRADIRALNSVIHVIDKVLLPPTGDDMDGDDEMEELLTIGEIVTNAANADEAEFKVLLAALEALNEAGTTPDLLATSVDPDAEITVFAPTDAAFVTLLGKLDLTADELLGNTALLESVVEYHIVAGKVTSGDLLEGFVPTLNGAAVEVDLSDGVTIKGAENAEDHQPKVITADIMASNGVIHVIDNVLLPPSMNIVEIASGIDMFSTLVDAVGEAGLVGRLSNDGPFTVFAPTNEAFTAFLEEFNLELGDIVANEKLLTAVLTYHVVEGRIFSSDLKDGKEVETLQGEEIEFEFEDEGVFIEDEADREIPIVGTDVQATNGVIHIIGNVLFPFDEDDLEDYYEYSDD